jgi:Leucine-rich repeat (LRR) protein
MSICLESGAIEISCDFEFDDWSWTDRLLYTCKTKDVNIEFPGVLVSDFVGQHDPGKNNTNVEQISVSWQTVKFIPKGIANIFANFKSLEIQISSLEFLQKSDFESYEKLEILILENNKIESVPENAFEILENLKEVSLSWNQLESLEPGLFKFNTKLEIISLSHNKIKFISVDAFPIFQIMPEIYLRENVCINQKFMKGSSQKNLTELIMANCQEIGLATTNLIENRDV